MIQKLGKNTLLAKMDIKSAFRLLKVYPGDFDLLEIKVLDKYITPSLIHIFSKHVLRF
jgi:hypothetical protein